LRFVLVCAYMRIKTEQFAVATTGKGTYEITDKIEALVRESKIENGVITIFAQHTSCSLIVMENADPTARRDLEEYFDRLVPENADYFEHSDFASFSDYSQRMAFWKDAPVKGYQL